MSIKFHPGDAMPKFALPAVGGGNVQIGGDGRWQLVIVYRGKHCPICKRYLGGLNEMKDDFAKLNTDIVAISADPKEKAEPDVVEMGLDLAVGYGLSVEQMRSLGLYISQPYAETETDREFAEPGLFVINPQGKVQIVDISNAPFSRPDLAGIARGIGVIQERGYPIRGTLA